MSKSALKVIESPPFYTKEVEIWSPDQTRDGHSLHYAITYLNSFRPELPAYFIGKYTRRGQVVLDPFCGSGTTSLEANLAGRLAYASDANPLALIITGAKLDPADIAEVTLLLQKVNFRHPLDLASYDRLFAPYYDLDTFREICNLRSFLKSNGTAVARFVEMIALSLLHGHTAGYFSVYSLPQVSVSSDEQERLNRKRRQSPDYRSVTPRIIRKAASVLRDGPFTSVRSLKAQNRLATCDARNLSYLGSSEVDLVVTSPPLPDGEGDLAQMWLKLWFADISPRSLQNAIYTGQSLDEWKIFMNEVLLELARVVKSGGRAVFDLRELRIDQTTVCLDQVLHKVVSSSLSRYWDVECALIHRQRFARLENCQQERDPSKLSRRNRMLVLRRK